LILILVGGPFWAIPAGLLIGAIIFGAGSLLVSSILAVLLFVGVIIAESLMFFGLLLIIIPIIFGIGIVTCIALALFVGLPVGVILGVSSFVAITILFMVLFTVGYPLMRWASMTGALTL